LEVDGYAIGRFCDFYLTTYFQGVVENVGPAELEVLRRIMAGNLVAFRYAQKLIDDYMARIQRKIKPLVRVPDNIQGNLEARFDVVLLPTGEVLSATLRKSSGVPAYDAAVERAIWKAQPLPVPDETDLFQDNFREFKLVFRPKD
jgi:colicin import membrane protein